MICADIVCLLELSQPFITIMRNEVLQMLAFIKGKTKKINDEEKQSIEAIIALCLFVIHTNIMNVSGDGQTFFKESKPTQL